MAQESTAPSPAQVHDLLAEAMEGTIGVRNPRPEVLDRALRAAREAAPLMRGPDGKRDASACEELGKELPGDLRAWLFELPSFLAKKGREEQGQELCDLYSPLFGPECMEAERAIVFLEAGKKEDARAYWEKCHEQYGEHPWVLLRGAALHERTGDVRGARRLHERALEAARGHEDRWQLRFAYDGLIHHLQENNEQAASVELGRRMLEDLPEIRDEFKTEQIVNTVPKVGRNDPCPCGSGKKYKKCCGHS